MCLLPAARLRHRAGVRSRRTSRLAYATRAVPAYAIAGLMRRAIPMSRHRPWE